jgi:hypothetical protein
MLSSMGVLGYMAVETECCACVEGGLRRFELNPFCRTFLFIHELFGCPLLPLFSEGFSVDL